MPSGSIQWRPGSQPPSPSPRGNTSPHSARKGNTRYNPLAGDRFGGASPPVRKQSPPLSPPSKQQQQAPPMVMMMHHQQQHQQQTTPFMMHHQQQHQAQPMMHQPQQVQAAMQRSMPPQQRKKKNSPPQTQTETLPWQRLSDSFSGGGLDDFSGNEMRGGGAAEQSRGHHRSHRATLDYDAQQDAVPLPLARPPPQPTAVRPLSASVFMPTEDPRYVPAQYHYQHQQPQQQMPSSRNYGYDAEYAHDQPQRVTNARADTTTAARYAAAAAAVASSSMVSSGPPVQPPADDARHTDNASSLEQSEVQRCTSPPSPLVRSEVVLGVPRSMDWMSGTTPTAASASAAVSIHHAMHDEEQQPTRITSRMGNAAEAVHTLEHQYLSTLQQLDAVERMYENLDQHNDALEEEFNKLRQHIGALRFHLSNKVYHEVRSVQCDMHALRQYVELVLCDHHANMREMSRLLLAEVTRCTVGSSRSDEPLLPYYGGADRDMAKSTSMRASSSGLPYGPTTFAPGGWLQAIFPSHPQTHFGAATGGTSAAAQQSSTADDAAMDHLFPTAATTVSNSSTAHERAVMAENGSLWGDTPPLPAAASPNPFACRRCHELEAQLAETKRQLVLAEGRLRVTQQDADRRVEKLKEVYSLREGTLTEELRLLRRALDLPDATELTTTTTNASLPDRGASQPISSNSKSKDVRPARTNALDSPCVVTGSVVSTTSPARTAGQEEEEEDDGIVTFAPVAKRLSAIMDLERRVKAAAVSSSSMKHMTAMRQTNTSSSSAVRPDKYSPHYQEMLEDAARRLLGKVQLSGGNQQQRHLALEASKPYQNEDADKKTAAEQQLNSDMKGPSNLARVAQGLWAEQLLAQRGLS